MNLTDEEITALTDTIETVVRGGKQGMKKQLEHQQRVIRQLWIKMCEADGIDSKSSFVTFSPDNPIAAKYNTAMTRYLDRRRQAAFVR